MYPRYIFIPAIAVGLICLFQGCTKPFSSAKSDDSNSMSSYGCAIAKNPALQDPSTIDEAIKLVNHLPKPLTMECFLANLKKPLKVYATNSTFSAQPAGGERSPRIFIISNDLIISVVPEGFGAAVVEFAEIVSPSSSIKGEIEFPVFEELSASAPYAKIVEPTLGGTSCRVCHQNETRDISITTGEAYVSDILRPDPYYRVTQATAKQYSIDCDPNVEGYRCAMLRTVYVDGKAVDVEFPR